MDFTSVEFYTIAFFVAMAFVGIFVRQKKTTPATSVISSLELDPAPPQQEGTSRLILLAHDGGKVTIEREGLLLCDGETVNLIATVIDDKITIQEKKGKISAFGGKESMYNGHVDVTFFLENNKNYLRYESSVAGQWCKLAFHNSPGNKVEKELSY
ncbi:MAG: hypothetical protein J6X22_06585 [Muribaculaceae bacterium]|nr:hypothetical protein [Muribaculaceae bacterium]